MMFKRRKKIESGTTLTELLVVMFILSLLSTMALVGYRDHQKKYSLSQSAQRLSSELRKAQNMAMSGVDIAGNYYGYGVYLSDDATSYLLYGDVNNDSIYQVGDTTIETISLLEKVRVKEIVPVANDIDVFFKSPNPTTYIDGSNLAGKTATITLEIIGESMEKNVIITTSGLIEVD